MTVQNAGSKVAPRTRGAAALDTRLDKRLMAYAAAAGAAGGGLLASAQPAQAHVVFTPANTVVDSITADKIDFSGDGTTDITIAGVNVGSYEVQINAFMPAGNGVFNDAAPAFFGVPFGPGEQFTTYKALIAQFSFGRYGTTATNGPWKGQPTNRYLGVKFLINGKTHFGWIRMSVKPVQATITGYAYETVPEKTIKAGDTGGVNGEKVTAILSSGVPATVGLLARGWDGLTLWRREEL